MARRSTVMTAFACVACLGVSVRGADKFPTFTDPTKAGADFEFQGEYLGKAKIDGDDQYWGAQIVALGDGKFMSIGYQGGLPGEGWKRGDRTEKGMGKLVDGAVKFAGDEFDATIKDRVLKVTDKEGRTIIELNKVERKSPTLGARAPVGAKVLFNGSSADGFENGKLVENNLLGATNCSSKQKLGDHTMHIEFRTPFMPTATGQARGNSGVYVQSRFEVQVLDSFGLEGANNECGGVYSIAQPNVNMCFPPLSWQTYDIEFRAARYDTAGNKTSNARLTVRHNGVLIHDNIELTKGTPGRFPEGATPEGVFLQDHGNPVAFRNIWVVEK